MTTLTEVEKLAIESETLLRAIVYDFVFPLVLHTALFVVHAGLAAYFLYHRWTRRKSSPFVHLWLYVVFAMFALHCVCWAIDVYTVWEATSLSLRWIDAYAAGASQPRVEAFSQPPQTVQGLAILFISLVGDSVSLWRAYVICGKQRWVRIMSIVVTTLILLFLGVLGVLFVLYVHSGGTTLSLAGWALLVTWVPHVISTSLIAHRTWCVLSSLSIRCAILRDSSRSHWRDIRDFAHQTNLRYSLAILLIMSESGIVYLCLYSLYIGLDLGQSSGGYSMSYKFFVPLSAMYPVVVLLLVAVRKSILERTISVASTRDIMRFAEPAGTQMSRLDAEDDIFTRIHQHETRQGSLRHEVTIDSAVALEGTILPTKKRHIPLGDGSGVNDEYEAMLTGSPYRSRASSVASDDEEEGMPIVVAENV